MHTELQWRQYIVHFKETNLENICSLIKNKGNGKSYERKKKRGKSENYDVDDYDSDTFKNHIYF